MRRTFRRGTGAVRGPGDRLVEVGAIVFAVGVVAVVATLVPFFAGGHRLPTAVYLLSGLAPAGLGLALSGLLRAAYASRRPPQR